MSVMSGSCGLAVSSLSNGRSSQSNVSVGALSLFRFAMPLSLRVEYDGCGMSAGATDADGRASSAAAWLPEAEANKEQFMRRRSMLCRVKMPSLLE